MGAAHITHGYADEGAVDSCQCELDYRWVAHTMAHTRIAYASRAHTLITVGISRVETATLCGTGYGVRPQNGCVV